MKKVFVILLAGGSGTRFGAQKQFLKINSQSLVQHALDVAKQVSKNIVLVLPKNIDQNIITLPDVDDGSVTLCEAGKERYDSVQNALNLLSKQNVQPDDIVCIHDVARAFTPVEVYERGISAINEGANAVVPTVEVTDTIRTNDGVTLQRHKLNIVQTPQVFTFSVIKKAYENFDQSVEQNITDDASLVEKLNESYADKDKFKVETIKGSYLSKKITYRGDEAMFHTNNSFQVMGSGFDVHPFEEDKPCFIAGLPFEGAGFKGHSDGDIVLHAVCDAILSAIGEVDLGTLFVADNSTQKNISSVAMLNKVVDLAVSKSFLINSLNIVFWSNFPKIKSKREDIIINIKNLLASICSAETMVSFSAKNGEGLGFVGANEGAMCQANILGVLKSNHF